MRESASTSVGARSAGRDGAQQRDENERNRGESAGARDRWCQVDELESDKERTVRRETNYL